MKDIIDNEFTKGNALDLPTILKWLLIGILGCIVFQSLEHLLDRTIVEFLNNRGIVGGITGYMVGSVFSIIPILVIFSSVISSFKKKYYNNEVNIQKTIKKLVVAYIIIVVLQVVFPIITNIFSNYNSDAPDPFSNFANWLSAFYIVETFIKYGIVASILLKSE